MAFTPTTEIRLLSVNFENDYKNVVYWSSLAEQESEMLSCTVKTCKEFTYQRKDDIIRVPYHIDELYNCNYVMYKNKAYTDKWFYAFITDMAYINDGRTDIKIETDVWGTWWDNIYVKPSFVEREHTDNDTFGRHTYPEGLETGEYIINKSKVDDYLLDEGTRCWVVAVTEAPTIVSYTPEEGFTYNKTEIKPVTGRMYGGIYSGLKYIPFYSVDALNKFINQYDAGKTDAIQCIFCVPSCLVSLNSSGEIATVNGAVNWSVNLGTCPTTVDGYTPRNKKLLCYPYTYLVASNRQGSSAIYHNEKFYKGGNRVFFTEGTITPGCSIHTYPIEYNNEGENLDEAISLGKLPICNWTSDVYTNWLTQNAINIGADVGTNLAQIGAGFALTASGGGSMLGVPMMANGLMGVLGSVGQHYQRQMIPDQSRGNINCGDVMHSGMWNTFIFYDMSVKAEYARIIDDFFDRYGYKVNRVKEPLKNHRAIWWYTKTIDVNINGAIPQKDLAKIRSIYDNGVTFWRNHNQVENYNLKEENKI